MEYMWRLTMKDGQVLQQYNEAGEEREFPADATVDVKEAAWVPRHGDGPSHTLLLEDSQQLIMARRHEVSAKIPDHITFYLLGCRQPGKDPSVLYINPDGSIARGVLVPA